MPYKRSGDYLFWHDDKGRVLRCVACDRPLEHTLDRLVCHKCPKSVEGAKKAANTRLQEPIERAVPFGQRLADGVDMLRLAGDMDEE